MADIRPMLSELKLAEWGYLQYWIHPQNGQSYPIFKLPKRETLIPVSGGSVTEKRHDNIKRTIETLVQRGVIGLPQIEEVKVQRERREEVVSVYRVGKRGSFVIVAQLSPEFTARLVDRWQELEAAQAPAIPGTLPQALRLAADQA